MYERLAGEHAPYNLKFVTNGVSCTTASIITAALGIRDLDTITAEDVLKIQHIHLLLVMFNAMQPGVFALSGWDLVGALPLPAEQVAHLMEDGDTRWIHRGAYDLVGIDPDAEFSAGGMPRPKTLYGSLPEQLQRPDSFASQLKKILSVRRAYDIAASRQILIPDVEHPGLLIMVHELPAGKGIQITALNFSSESIVETLHLPGIAPGPVVDIINERVEGDLTEEGEFTITLDAYEGLALRVVSMVSPMM
jgi:trehalose synthase